MLAAPMRPPVPRALLAAVVLLAACRGCPGNTPGRGASGAGTERPGPTPVTITMAYGSEKRTWLEEQLKLFAATSPRTAAGRRGAHARQAADRHPLRGRGGRRGLAGADWFQHLRSREVQEQALRLGFRPADPAVPLKNQDPSNPFNRLGPYGLQLDLPPAAPSPDGAIVRNLLSMWTRIVPRTP